MARMKFLCDAERCIECNGCVTACKNENEVPWGVKEGLPANFVVFDCQDEAEAIRLRPAARWVVRQGRVVAETEPARSVVFEGDAARPVTFTREGAGRMEGVAT